MSNKIHWIVYVCTFAVYGIIKYLIEKDRPLYVEYFLKIAYANIAAIMLYFVLRTIVYFPMNLFMVLAFQAVFLVYDYAYSMFINYYNHKLRKILFKN